MRQRKCAPPARPAFTILELLVVIGIMALIVSLGVGAVMSIILGQEKKATELAVKRLNEANIAAGRAVFDQAKELPVPASVINLAGGDPRRAKVIWQKLQLKRNFPMTFREALYPWAIDGNPPSAAVYPPLPATTGAPLGTGLNSPIPAADLPPLDVFVKAIQKIPAVAPAGIYSPDESSHLLYLTLSVTRRGNTFDAEQALGPGSIYVDPATDGGLSGFKDAWSQPIVFFRWPADFPDNRPVTTGDPQDPEPTLVDRNWNNPTNQAMNGPVYWFEQLCHPIHNPATGDPVAFYAPATIVSSGPNKRLGLLLSPSNAVSPNFGMALDATDPQGANDNIYSTTLK